MATLQQDTAHEQRVMNRTIYETKHRRTKEKPMTLRAVIARATGLIGSNLAEHLLSKGWEVYGVARKPQGGIPGFARSPPIIPA